MPVFQRLCTAIVLTVSSIAAAAEYDLVILGGRVLDPDTGLDATLNVGIRDNEITAITEDPLVGEVSLDASGHVVAPGFIDLHAHGQDPISRALQAQDGVTTALELEIGVYPVKPWYDAQAGMSPIHYGATVGHLPARVKVKTGMDAGHTATAPPSQRAQMAGGAWSTAPATPEEIEQMKSLLRMGLQEGALGLGYGIAYTPGATQQEIYETMKVAPELGVPVFVHMREGNEFPLDEPLGAVQEMLANAAATGASLHIVHLNSSTEEQAQTALEMIRNARDRGIDVTTESYPWAAGSTRLESALFDNWGDNGEKFEDLLWVETGERLTKKSFRKYRKQGGWVVIFGQDPVLVDWLVAQPDVILASDGIPFVAGKAHPRGAGTFARVLGKYVRDDGALTLMDALRKMTLLPAQRLENFAPQMKRKGRLQVGMDADVVVFDANTVNARATYEDPAQPSAGITHVIVAGTPVVRDGSLQEGVHPGQAITSVTPRS